jgi:hypothetical protein
METQIFHHAKIKKSSQRNQNPSRYYNSVTNLSSFNITQNLGSFKNPHIEKIDLLLLIPRGQNPLR